MKMFNKRFYILVSFWLLPVLFVMFGPYGDSRVAAVDTNTYKSLKLFTEVIDIVEKNYVEDVKTQTLIQEAINGMIRSLDPHSAFLTPDQYKELQVDTSGQFGGLGIVITLQNDQLTVVSPIEDTPAFKAGIKTGDKILKIDGQTTKGIAITDAVKKMRGPENTKVTLTIMRKEFTQPKDFVITRATIKIKSVKPQVFDGNIGYIRLSNFQESTTDELKKALQEINGKAKPLKGLILDVRNNPGGLLEQAVKVSDAFIKSGPIVSTKGRVKTVEATFVARDDGNEPTCPMVVIVNEGTASASEIISGALQDNSRAIILGTKTFGKGSVQTVIPLEDGSAIKLSTAKYFTPKGRSIQAEGIVPDIVVEFVKMPEEEEGPETVIREKDLKGHIKGEKEAARPKETPEKKAEKKEEKKEKDPLARDNQLKSAVDILKSWEVFSKSGR